MADLTPAPLYDDIDGVPEGGTAYWLDVSDDARMRFAIWPGSLDGPETGTVFLFPGRTEYIEKYANAVARLTAQGYGVLVIDWRGQGLSTRPNGDVTLGHIEDFAVYQSDFDALLRCEIVTQLPQPFNLLCHSMGGCIGLRTLHNHPDLFKSAAFSGPMWGVNTPGGQDWLAKAVIWLLDTLGYGQKHMPFASKPHNYVEHQDFAGNVLTNNPEIYAWLRAILAQHKDLGLGGPSVRWLRQAYREGDALNQMPVPKTPFMTLLGNQETVVSPSKIIAYHHKPGAGNLTLVADVKHEIFMEIDAKRDFAWQHILPFFKAPTPSQTAIEHV